jgi:serine/threonine protein kinase
MKRLVLLILDGESFRTPSLVKALEQQGWDLVRLDSASLMRELATSANADLGLFDPSRLSPKGLLALKALRERNPALALAALGSAGQVPAWFDPAGFEPGLHWLDPELPPAEWPGVLTSFLGGYVPAAAKFTAEDLFGDILDDLETVAEREPQSRPALPDQIEFLDPVSAEPSAPVEPEEEPVLEQFGNYNLLEKVAVGGMAELFKARQRGPHDFEKIVAIKRILPHLSDNDEFVRMFIDEAKLAAQLNHPNIVQIFDLGKASGSYYIAMEFVDGRDLRNLLRKVREYKLPMPEVLAASVIMKMASALDYAHRKRAIDDKELKLVHRDISPQNILISYEGGVKLVDFGIAKAATKSTQTHAGALKGKLLYMSPEQALGQPLDGRSDIYSLGLVLAELLTGERCFQADSELGVLEKVRLGKVMEIRAVNPGISVEMGTILDKILVKDVDRRYASARLLERDLKALLVKQRYEPTEHDLAEYVNTLLKGTREEVESLLASRFGPPREPQPLPAPETGQPAPATAGAPGSDEQLTLAGLPRPAEPTHAPAPAPAVPAMSAAARPGVRPAQGAGRGWLWSALLLLLLLAVGAYWILHH